MTETTHLLHLSPWAVAGVLYGLAVLDCSFASYRCAGGKNAAIDKRKYYAKALLKGAVCSNFAVGAAAVLIAISTNMQPERLLLFAEAGRYALDVYIPYAAIVLASLALRAIPEADVRAVMQTVVLGPFTFKGQGNSRGYWRDLLKHAKLALRSQQMFTVNRGASHSGKIDGNT